MKQSLRACGVCLSFALCAGTPAQADPIFVELGAIYLLSQPGQPVSGGVFAARCSIRPRAPMAPT